MGDKGSRLDFKMEETRYVLCCKGKNPEENEKLRRVKVGVRVGVRELKRWKGMESLKQVQGLEKKPVKQSQCL